MGIFSRFEGRMEDGIEGTANKMFDAPISPVQISKKAEKAMRREKMVGAGREYAPTLYTVLVNVDDDQRLFGYYPTLAGETETYLVAKAQEEGLAMDGQPLVRFIVDDKLRHGKFDIIAEMVSAPIVDQLRQEEMARYGLAPAPTYQRHEMQHQQLPDVPEEEIDRSIDYGEYTFDSKDWDSYAEPDPQPAVTQYMGIQNAPTSQQGQAAFIPALLTDLSSNRKYPLDKQRLILGRSSSSDVAVSDINVSRSHAEIRYESRGQWAITDLGSTNGTYLNGKRITTAPLNEGDRIKVGTIELVFSLR